MLEPNEAVTLWIALDDIDEENGCMRYVKDHINVAYGPTAHPTYSVSRRGYRITRRRTGNGKWPCAPVRVTCSPTTA